jgi:hypothetical protein
MIENPYNPLQPVGDPTLFVGREDALAFLQLHLAGRITRNALVILGQYGMGKSSLLTQVPLVVDERYPSINIDVSALELDDPVALVAAIVDQTRATMNTIQASTYRLPPFPDPTDPDIDLLVWLSDEFLDVVFAAIRRERHLILMLDDAHLLLDAIKDGHFPPDFMDYWMGLLERYEQLDILATVDITYEDIILSVPLFSDTNLHHRLTNLSPNEASILVTEPIAENYQFAPEALDRVLELGGGHPFHLHSISRLVYRRWQEGRHVGTISLPDVNAIYPMALEMAEQTISSLWRHIRQNERLALTALLDLRQQQASGRFTIRLNVIQDWLDSAGYTLDNVQLSAALRGLEYYGVLQVDESGAYDVVSGIQADWLTHNRISEQDEKPSTPIAERFSLMGLIAVGVVILIILGGAWAVGFFENNENDGQPNSNSGRATVTLGVDFELTREADNLTQTAISAPPAPSQTPLPSSTPTPLPVFRFGG